MTNRKGKSPVDLPWKCWSLNPLLQRQIRRLIESLRKDSTIGLHLGAGSHRLEHLINCDLVNEQADALIDCRSLAAIKDNSVDYLETHHMIEHLSIKGAEQAFREWYRVLRVGGHLVLTCPDLTRVAWRWLYLSACNRLFDCQAQRDYTVKMLYGSQENEAMFHRNGFDRQRLRRLLTEAGFDVLFEHSPFPKRPTPSLVMIAHRP